MGGMGGMGMGGMGMGGMGMMNPMMMGMGGMGGMGMGMGGMVSLPSCLRVLIRFLLCPAGFPVHSTSSAITSTSIGLPPYQHTSPPSLPASPASPSRLAIPPTSPFHPLPFSIINCPFLLLSSLRTPLILRAWAED
jgi:hypothetical protein